MTFSVGLNLIDVRSGEKIRSSPRLDVPKVGFTNFTSWERDRPIVTWESLRTTETQGCSRRTVRARSVGFFPRPITPAWSGLTKVLRLTMPFRVSGSIVHWLAWLFTRMIYLKPTRRKAGFIEHDPARYFLSLQLPKSPNWRTGCNNRLGTRNCVEVLRTTTKRRKKFLIGFIHKKDAQWYFLKITMLKTFGLFWESASRSIPLRGLKC